VAPAGRRAATDLVVTGHTHDVRIETRDGKLLVNPGGRCGWVTGRRTAAVVDLDALSAELIEVTT
jgi:putative phosphoesterase